MHASSDKNWIHVPTNPVLGNMAPTAPDIQAPVVLSPNCVRTGRTNAHNTSFPVYEQVGSTQGLSTFQLTVKYPCFRMNDELAMAMALVYENRPHILHLAKQSRNLGPRVQSIMQHYASHARQPTPDNVAQHRSSGTFFDVEDGTFIA